MPSGRKLDGNKRDGQGFGSRKKVREQLKKKKGSSLETVGIRTAHARKWEKGSSGKKEKNVRDESTEKKELRKDKVWN
jgi:hypothetical protein